ncbi:hypothetical protein MANES_08G004111v8 [Manihot esculenta]|uniref:Uncharacterized protein n=1 Tax=Manihot esculenta TaxID=3983 RepID=A0ACB7H9J5_MANES|nr:hypothetical protein MANES_08G004111v8 [Manihot esculenta]
MSPTSLSFRNMLQDSFLLILHVFFAVIIILVLKKLVAKKEIGEITSCSASDDLRRLTCAVGTNIFSHCL